MSQDKEVKKDADLEARTEECEKRLAHLMSKMAIKLPSNDSNAEFKEKVLARIDELRAALTTAHSKMTTLEKENKELKKSKGKLEYRILHLMNTLAEEEKKNVKSS
eukprot:TRINITY_DN145_c1_g1_i1.p1 TRINITY_DN145_c1_g1~~TRINITY_DN145_c1_g1_i1.p1  ORF type:complete len:106 (-),score=25.79 TRINITY_DN145_c1_g1_i1:205-522(-)